MRVVITVLLIHRIPYITINTSYMLEGNMDLYRGDGFHYYSLYIMPEKDMSRSQQYCDSTKVKGQGFFNYLTLVV